MKILFIRHGHTTGDVEDRYGGDYDDHLSIEGNKQAKSLAEELKNKNIEVIISSPLIRARETASVIAHGNIPVEIEQDLRERNQYGILTGKVKSEAKQEYPDLVEMLKDKFNTIEGAESYDDFKTRLQKAFDQLISNTKNECIAVVWHGGPMRVLFRDILKKGEIEYGYCGWVELERQGVSFAITDSKRIEFLF